MHSTPLLSLFWILSGRIEEFEAGVVRPSSPTRKFAATQTDCFPSSTGHEVTVLVTLPVLEWSLWTWWLTVSALFNPRVSYAANT